MADEYTVYRIRWIRAGQWGELIWTGNWTRWGSPSRNSVHDFKALKAARKTWGRLAGGVPDGDRLEVLESQLDGSWKVVHPVTPEAVTP